MRIVDLIAGWVVVLMGAIHSLIALKLAGTQAMLFLCSGLLLMLVGALNLLRVRYGAVAGGVRAVSIAANLVLLAFTVLVATRLPLRNNPQLMFGLAIVLLITVLSITRSPERA